MIPIEMNPGPGTRHVKWVGDTLRFTLRVAHSPDSQQGFRAFLRTNIGQAHLIRQDIIESVDQDGSYLETSWVDIPMFSHEGAWHLTLRLAQPGYFRAKAYLLEAEGKQIWPAGEDMGVSVHPSWTRSGNILYCAFPRMFGSTRTLKRNIAPELEGPIKALDQRGYHVIPPSGTLRNLKSELPHIMGTLGARIIHLLPVNPVPTTYARMGRFGSPYACRDLTAIDPALVEFDRKTTGVQQFIELVDAVHARGGRVFLDMVVNHTGWGSTLQEEHPEWFEKDKEGAFVSPGAWGNIWEDLVELSHHHPLLRVELAEAFLVWCRRGVDGFRCDAGYMVPMPVWRYIVARVQTEFPDVVFFLEGLGGAWHDTAQLLTAGHMQWAYSELFQEYTSVQINGYLKHALFQSRSSGLLVHYSETHDNNRLAAEGRAWTLLRNRLCALTSACGGYGFTCGVEWLAEEKILVHGSTGMNWGHPDNIIAELTLLNRVLVEHPCFYSDAQVELLTGIEAPAVAVFRSHEQSGSKILVLINPDKDNNHILPIKNNQPHIGSLERFNLDLLGQSLPETRMSKGEVEYLLPPASVFCLSTAPLDQLKGLEWSQRRQLADWAFSLMQTFLAGDRAGDCDWQGLADLVIKEPLRFLSSLRLLKEWDRTPLLEYLEAVMAKNPFPSLVLWSPGDVNKTVLVPEGHLIVAEAPFDFEIIIEQSDKPIAPRARSIRMGDVSLAVLDSRGLRSECVMKMVCFLPEGVQRIEGPLKVQSPVFQVKRVYTRSDLADGFRHELNIPKVLLTNGRGGMARIPVDFYSTTSKYDAVLASNLNPNFPEDRHVFVKRLRGWAMVDGFLQPLDRQHLMEIEPGPPVRWRFELVAGGGTRVWLDVVADMVHGENTVVFQYQWRTIPGQEGEIREVSLTLRPDIEDRSFHTQTEKNGAAEHHFAQHTRAMEDKCGFEFTPGSNRTLRVFTPSPARYHAQPEWADAIAHPIEGSRGQIAHGAAFSPGWFQIAPEEMETVYLVFTSENKTYSREDIKGLKSFGPPSEDSETSKTSKGLELEDALNRAVKSYVVNRDDGKTVIAGYPWFLDWGRDSLICARGMIAAGMEMEVFDLLRVFGKFEHKGTLPNSIHGDNASNRDTSDAPLWFSVVLEELLEACENRASLLDRIRNESVDAKGRTLLKVVSDIASGYLSGTSNGIYVDAESGLVWSPSHFTWMDTNHPAGTPRMGYPIEIQALWIRLLRFLSRENLSGQGPDWAAAAKKAESSVDALYWVEDKGYYADCILAESGVSAWQGTRDTAFRCNCLFMASLGLTNNLRAQRTVEAALSHLVVPGAIRSLAPWPVDVPLEIRNSQGDLINDPGMPYWGHYEGDEDSQRKPAYHNGTAWTWVFPSVCEAMIEAWQGDKAALESARSYLSSVIGLVETGCLGQIPEVLDGDTPHQQRGCDAQAWGVTETLRVWLKIQKVIRKNQKP